MAHSGRWLDGVRSGSNPGHDAWRRDLHGAGGGQTSQHPLGHWGTGWGPGLLLSRGGEGGRGFWTQNLVYQKWPDQIFPVANFVFSHDGHFGLGRGGGGFWGRAPHPPLVFNYSKEALVGTVALGSYPSAVGSEAPEAAAVATLHSKKKGP